MFWRGDHPWWDTTLWIGSEAGIQEKGSERALLGSGKSRLGVGAHGIFLPLNPCVEPISGRVGDTVDFDPEERPAAIKGSVGLWSSRAPA
jgi:hypothetical protein